VLLISVGGAAALTAAGATGEASAQTDNLLVNPDFATGDLTGWTCDAGTATVVTSPVYPGSTHSLAGSPTSSDDAECSQTVSVRPDTSYTLSGYVEGAYVYLGITGATDDWTPSATTWDELTTTVTTSSSQTSLQVYVHGWYAQGPYYAGNLALTGPPGPSPTWRPSGRTAAMSR
jgi:hypothetical protein